MSSKGTTSGGTDAKPMPPTGDGENGIADALVARLANPKPPNTLRVAAPADPLRNWRRLARSITSRIDSFCDGLILLSLSG